MRAADEHLYEYAVVRYMPRPERGECVNIGLVMMNKRKRWLKGKIKLVQEKIRAIHPNADIEYLKKQAALFERKDVPERDLAIEEKYRWLTAVKSASIRVSPSHPGLFPNIEPANLNTEQIMEMEFERLFGLFID